MDKSMRSSLAIGIIMVLIGGLFLLGQFVPGFGQLFSGHNFWPWIIIGVGAAMIVIGVLTGAPGMAVPGCIIGGIGGILFYQNVTGAWGTWSYAWALIPGFAGVGVILARLLGDTKQSIRSGISTIITSLVMFTIFGALLGGLFRGQGFLGDYWPVLLIAAGLLILVNGFIKWKD